MSETSTMRTKAPIDEYVFLEKTINRLMRVSYFLQDER